MTPYSPDAGKMACRHEPTAKPSHGYNLCKWCGVLVESVPCERCDGLGLPPLGDPRVECRGCDGTGVASWRETP